jgi:hypothetical protein
VTPLQRRRMLVAMDVAPAIPSLAQRRSWCFIDDSKPPEGEADGSFDTFTRWLNHAASWIGWSGAKCFDALDRPCRIGGDFMRARDEEAFPVRFYMPDRFDAPMPPMNDRLYQAMTILAKDGGDVHVEDIAKGLKLKTLRSTPLDYAVQLGWIETPRTGVRRITDAGRVRWTDERRMRSRAASEKPL